MPRRRPFPGEAGEGSRILPVAGGGLLAAGRGWLLPSTAPGPARTIFADMPDGSGAVPTVRLSARSGARIRKPVSQAAIFGGFEVCMMGEGFFACRTPTRSRTGSAFRSHGIGVPCHSTGLFVKALRNASNHAGVTAFCCHGDVEAFGSPKTTDFPARVYVTAVPRLGACPWATGRGDPNPKTRGTTNQEGGRGWVRPASTGSDRSERVRRTCARHAGTVTMMEGTQAR